jgi:heptosyltransferase I
MVVFPAMPVPRLDRIAIVMLSAIGDSVHVLPVINALKRHSPTSRVTWFLAPGPASLVRGHPAIDEIIEFQARGGLREWLDMRATLTNRTFDVVLDFQVALKAGLLTSLIDAPVKLGFDRRRARDLNWLFTNRKIPPRANQHVQDQYFEFLDALGVPHDRVEWGLGPWPNERGLAKRLLPATDRPLAAIAIASAKVERNWPAERWAEVVDALHERFGLHAVLLGGKSDAELAAEAIIMRNAKHTPVSTLGCTLREMVSVIDASTLVISPDTAPAHIANALGKPVVGLFAATDPKRTGPYRARQDLFVNAYSDPGEENQILMERRLGRAERISVSDVLERVERWQRSRP